MSIYLAHQYLDRAAVARENEPAIIYQNDEISYGDLVRFTDKMANLLQRLTRKPGERICIVLPKSIHAIVSMFAILKAGAVYVPVDDESPEERMRDIVADCLPTAIICNRLTLGSVERLTDLWDLRFKIILLEERHANFDSPETERYFLSDIESESETLRPCSIIDQDLAYILYTSGTTGKPKGVMINHLNILNYIQWAVDYFEIKSEDRILNTSPLHFDMSVFDIFCSISAGSRLYLIPKKMQLFPKKIINLIGDEEITVWKAISFLLVYFIKARALKPSIMPALRTIIFSGEILPTKYLIEWMKTFPDKSFYNAYGPTEATGISVCYRIEKPPENPAESTPIGKACSNTDILAVDEHGRIVSPGESGELLIRGSGLSPGYWNNPEKTKEAFRSVGIGHCAKGRVYHTGDIVKRLSNGEDYIFIGRKDNQIKYMGYRIESWEIEAAIYEAGNISGAAVISINAGESENPEIVAFVEAEKGLDKSGIMAFLRKRLPAYMIPHKMKALARLPRTENGKINRPALKSEYLRNIH